MSEDRERGRPTKYKPEYAEQAYKMSLLGLTDLELASYFEVTESTIYNWKIEYPNFLEAIKNGKEVSDAEVVVSLRKRALGYVGQDGKEVPPDPTSMIFWLKNRQPRKWRDKQEIQQDITVSGQPIITFADTSKKKEENE